MRWYLFIFLGLFLTGFISGFNITNTNLNFGNYSIYINGTINVSRILIIDSINLYNLTSGGNFTNLNDTDISVINFYNIKEPNNDLIWDNSSELYNLSTVNITLQANQSFELTENEPGPTTIYLLRPNDNTEDTDGVVEFYYNVSSPSLTILNCSLYLDNVFKGYDNTITREIEQYFRVINMYESDSVKWYINCVTSISSSVNSSIYTLDTKLGSTGSDSGSGGVGDGDFIIPPNFSVIVDNATIEVVDDTVIDEGEDETNVLPYLMIILFFGSIIFILVFWKRKMFKDIFGLLGKIKEKNI